MKSKSEIKQRLMRSAIKHWGIKNGEQLDPIVRLLIEVFCESVYENEISIEEIRERLLEQISTSLTPDSLIAPKPAHSVMTAIPIEPEMEIDRLTIFYTDRLTNAAAKYELKALNFAPVADQIKLVRGEIKHLLAEKHLYRMDFMGEKELLTKAGSFYQGLNRTVYIGFDLDKKIKSLKDIHFYVDFANTPDKHQLYELLKHTAWSINGQPLEMRTGLASQQTNGSLSGGIFSLYNILHTSDEEVMELYRKQFLHIYTDVRIKALEKAPFPGELLPFFPERVNSLEPQYWIKIVFPAYFKRDDLEEISIRMNAFPVSNKQINNHTLFRSKSMTGILPLPMAPGEYFLAVENVDDSAGKTYHFLPYSLSDNPLGGTYTIKRGGTERFSSRNLKDLTEQFTNLLRTELVTFSAFKIENLDDSILKMEQVMQALRNKVGENNHKIKEAPTYLLIDSEDTESSKTTNIDAVFWTTNCVLANDLLYGTTFSPLKTIPIEKDTCYLLKASSGGKIAPQKEAMLMAYKYALTTRDQLFSVRDIENYCYMKYSDKVQQVKVSQGIACSKNPNHGLTRTIDVAIEPTPEYKEMFDTIAAGELKTELEKRSPATYNYRILLENNNKTNPIR